MTGRPGGWARRHPRVVDGAVAMAVLLYTVPQAGPPAVTPPVPWLTGVALGAALCGAFLLCRHRPVGGFAVVLGLLGFQLMLGIGFLPADVVLLLALYRVALDRPRTISLPAGALTGLAVVLAALRWDDPYFATPEVLSALALVVSMWVWGSAVGVRRAYVAALEDRAAQLARHREDQDRIVAAAERARIAREIHDVVSHGLGVVVVLARGAAAGVDSDPTRARGAMRDVERTGRTALAEMRQMLHVLRDDEPGSPAPAPGLARLDALVEDARSAGAPVELTRRGAGRVLPAGVDLAVYRIVQEALTNARRHGGPELTRIRVTVDVGDAGVEVRIRDDGDGPPPGQRPPGGHGLTGMRERAGACGGELRAGPAAGGGFEVVANLPIGDPA